MEKKNQPTNTKMRRLKRLAHDLYMPEYTKIWRNKFIEKRCDWNQLWLMKNMQNSKSRTAEQRISVQGRCSSRSHSFSPN